MRLLFWAVLIFLAIFRILTFKTPFSDGQKIRINNRVFQEPLKTGAFQKINLGGLVVYLPAYPEINYGDEITVEGTVENGELTRAKVVSIGKTPGFLPSFRQRVIIFYRRSLPEPHASLIAGISLGSKSGLTWDFWDSLKKTGLAHVVVASGTNVMMVASFLTSIAVFLVNRRLAIPFILLGIWLYAFLSGFDAPIIRAAIMASFVFVSQELGRIAESFRILLITGFMMLIIKPTWIYDLGFTLSFVSAGSLIIFQSKINKKIEKVPAIFREGISTSLAAQIGVAPILFVTFGQFNILSPISNLLVLWSVPLIMVIGVIAACIGLVIPFLGQLVLYLVYPLTSWFIWIVKTVA